MNLTTIFLGSLLTVALGQECGHRNTNRLSTYILGGAEAEPNEFPWMVSLQVKFLDDWEHICGGSIINEKWIATAAHCLVAEEPTNMKVVAGAHFWDRKTPFVQTRNVSRWVIHRAWNVRGVQNDLALMELDSPVTFNSRTVLPICLPTTEDMATFDDAICVASGWGKTHFRDFQSSTPALLKVDLPVVPLDVCKANYADLMTVEMTDTKICAGRRDEDGFGVCPGDSGGPLACEKDGRYFLTGISSFGYECGSPAHPPVFTRIAAFREWIDEIIGS